MPNGSKYSPKLLRYVFDPFEDIKIEPGRKQAVLDSIGEFVLNEILQSVGSGSSPVSGEGWKKTLSPEYKKEKQEISGSAFANMELFGTMLDSLNVSKFGRDKLKLEISGLEAEKADGHNQLTGRKSNLPQRRFIPDEDQSFKQKISRGIKQLASEFGESKKQPILKKNKPEDKDRDIDSVFTTIEAQSILDNLFKE